MEIETLNYYRIEIVSKYQENYEMSVLVLKRKDECTHDLFSCL